MSDTSDGSMDTDDDTSEWKTQKSRGDKRKFVKLTKPQIKDIIGIENQSKKTKADKSTPQKASTSYHSTTNKNTLFSHNRNTTENIAIPPRDNTHTNNSTTAPLNSSDNSKKHKNYSAKMNEIINRNFKHLFYISADENLTRMAISDIWEMEIPNSEDVIFKTKKGFLLKSNQEKNKINQILLKLTQNKKINNFQETTSLNTTRQTTAMTSNSYSAVIGSVEHEVQDKEISEFLKKININHRYCRRIISKATNSPTLLIRVITSCFTSFTYMVLVKIRYAVPFTNCMYLFRMLYYYCISRYTSINIIIIIII